jgi:hypothetical protein
MNYTNYLAIMGCYGFGCYLSYRMGFNKGGQKATNDLVDCLAEYYHQPPEMVVKLLRMMLDKLEKIHKAKQC